MTFTGLNNEFVRVYVVLGDRGERRFTTLGIAKTAARLYKRREFSAHWEYRGQDVGRRGETKGHCKYSLSRTGNWSQKSEPAFTK